MSQAHGSPRALVVIPDAPRRPKAAYLKRNVEVTFQGFRLCSGYRGQSVEEVERRAAVALGVHRASCVLDLDEDESADSVTVMVFEPVPLFAETASEIKLLSGEAVPIRGGLPTGLVYEGLARRLSCKVEQVRLVFECSCGDRNHDKASWHRGEHVAEGEPVTAVALMTELEFEADSWMFH